MCIEMINVATRAERSFLTEKPSCAATLMHTIILYASHVPYYRLNSGHMILVICVSVCSLFLMIYFGDGT